MNACWWKHEIRVIDIDPHHSGCDREFVECSRCGMTGIKCDEGYILASRAEWEDKKLDRRAHKLAIEEIVARKKAELIAGRHQ